MPKRKGRRVVSKRVRNLAKLVDPDRSYTVDEAIDLIKSCPYKCKFDESVDLAIKLNLDTKQADQLVRGAFSLPKGTGKTMRVVAFCEGSLVEEALKAGALAAGGEDLAKKVADGWMDFDVAVAHPASMRYVSRLGKVLGPKGLMPSAKTGSVTPDIAKAVAEFKAGKVEFRNDQYGNVHVTVGKVSFPREDLIENVRAFISHILAIRPPAVKGTYIQKVSISTTMGPGIRLAV
ncbi:MAG: 50S ribosomal protein L1 [Planctomycetota bacterium]|nr:50S ribosomal protein L1 [Planctomycetota bacterium]